MTREKIKTTAIINNIDVHCHADKISFTAFSLSPEDNECITNIIKEESPVRIKIDLQKSDKDFPPIEVEGTMKGFKISKTCDTPNIIGLQFSTRQVGQITNYIRSKEVISLTFTQIQKQIPFADDQTGEPE